MLCRILQWTECAGCKLQPMKMRFYILVSIIIKLLLTPPLSTPPLHPIQSWHKCYTLPHHLHKTLLPLNPNLFLWVRVRHQVQDLWHLYAFVLDGLLQLILHFAIAPYLSVHRFFRWFDIEISKVHVANIKYVFYFTDGEDNRLQGVVGWDKDCSREFL